MMVIDIWHCSIFFNFVKIVAVSIDIKIPGKLNTIVTKFCNGRTIDVSTSPTKHKTITVCNFIEGCTRQY